VRFAIITTAVAAAIATLFVAQITGPQMSSDQFLTAVRCTAYENIGRSDPALAEAKWRLNSEARLQPVETAVLARAEVTEIARKAVSIQTAADVAMIHQERAAACSGAQHATGADSPSAV
jgi:hypothetical protein